MSETKTIKPLIINGLNVNFVEPEGVEPSSNKGVQ